MSADHTLSDQPRLPTPPLLGASGLTHVEGSGGSPWAATKTHLPSPVAAPSNPWSCVPSDTMDTAPKEARWT